MNTVLGSLHYRQFRKIGLIEKRFICLYEKALDTFGAKSFLWREEVYDTYGRPPEYVRDLAEFVQDGGVQAALTRMRRAAELREAAYISVLPDAFKNAEELIFDVWREHAAKTATRGRALVREDGNAVATAAILHDFYADAMPWDKGDRVLIANEEQYAWEATFLLHRDIWEEAGVRYEFMRRLYELWFRTFIREIHADCRFAVDDSVSPRVYRILSGASEAKDLRLEIMR